jgi:hypothetical protein
LISGRFTITSLFSRRATASRSPQRASRTGSAICATRQACPAARQPWAAQGRMPAPRRGRMFDQHHCGYQRPRQLARGSAIHGRGRPGAHGSLGDPTYGVKRPAITRHPAIS